MENYVKNLYDLDVMASELLGDFDADDNYVIKDDLIKELLVAKKEMTDYSPDKIQAFALVGAYKLNFEIYIQEGEENKKRAGLFLIEKGRLGFITKDLYTFIGACVLDNNGAFLDNLKKEFNICTHDESTGNDIANSKLLALLNKKNERKQAYNGLVLSVGDLDKLYVIKMISLIKSTGTYGSKFMSELRLMVLEKKLNKSSPTYWRDLKVMLDKMVITNSGVFGEVITKKIETLQGDYIKSVKNASTVKAEEKSSSKSKDGKPYKFEGGGTIKMPNLAILKWSDLFQVFKPVVVEINIGKTLIGKAPAKSGQKQNSKFFYKRYLYAPRNAEVHNVGSSGRGTCDGIFENSKYTTTMGGLNTQNKEDDRIL